MPIMASKRKHLSHLGRKEDAESLFRGLGVAIKDRDGRAAEKLCEALFFEVVNGHGYVVADFSPKIRGEKFSIVVNLHVNMNKGDEHHLVSRTYQTNEISLELAHPSNKMLGALVVKDIISILNIGISRMFLELVLKDGGRPAEDYEGHAFYALAKSI